MTAPGKRGKAGEDYACGLLEKAGYRIVGRNVHSRYGEVDLIAVREPVIAFVEVKTRKADALIGGGAAVGPAKQRRIIATALAFLQDHPEYNQQPRFDLVLVHTDGRGGITRHEIIEGAFDGEAYEKRRDPRF